MYLCFANRIFYYYLGIIILAFQMCIKYAIKLIVKVLTIHVISLISEPHVLLFRRPKQPTPTSCSCGNNSVQEESKTLISV
jgi:hypothetical protein